ncbi:MAG TPA: acetyl-CoA carboxylase carboxyltransferase subunit alpha [Terriglobales bacterium]|nr:acetyl-CoA carboxylase carboxyltransferase subunit alpha [Terriglobales bacterium]
MTSVSTKRARESRDPSSQAAIASGVRFMVQLLRLRAESLWQTATNGGEREVNLASKAQGELERIEKQIEQLEQAAGQNQDARRQLARLHEQVNALRQQIYAHLHAWRITELARHPQRPYTLDYVERIFSDWSEIHGDRAFGDDHALVTGMARFHGQDVMLIGHQKGRDTKQRLYRNFGEANPEGYRKALRVMRLAEKYGRPVITLIDTPGAYPGIGAEERGQAEAIARNLREMARLQVPIVAVITGEGGSGGALGVAVADRVLMMENSIYSVISPEGCASIMWRDPAKKDLAAEALRITASDLTELGCVDGVIPEPEGGAHADHDAAAAMLDQALQRELDALKGIPVETLLNNRYAKFRQMARFFTE